MNLPGNYFKYHFKTTCTKLIYIVVMCMAVIALSSANKYDSVSPFAGDLMDSSMLSFLSTVLMIMSIVFPLLEMRPFNNKNNLDLLFGAPLSRTNMFLTRFFNGLLQMELTYTAIFIAWVFLHLLKGENALNPEYVPLVYVLQALMGAVAYVFHTFIFVQANSNKLGTVLLLMYYHASIGFHSALSLLTSSDDITVNLGFSTPLTSMVVVTTYLDSLLVKVKTYDNTINEIVYTNQEPAVPHAHIIGLLIIFVGIAIFMTAFMRKKFKNKIPTDGLTSFGLKMLIAFGATIITSHALSQFGSMRSLIELLVVGF
ncbi:MAG: hypothetical protein E7312_06920 [Clostridiales bacterium]|nr:hypothetical protein [Clostridiales bacterium]